MYNTVTLLKQTSRTIYSQSGTFHIISVFRRIPVKRRIPVLPRIPPSNLRDASRFLFSSSLFLGGALRVVTAHSCLAPRISSRLGAFPKLGYSV